MNLIESYCKHKYYNLSNSEKLLKKIQEKIDPSITNIDSMFLNIFHNMLETEPCFYWDKKVYEKTKNNFEKLVSSASNIEIDENIFNYFLMGYNSYTQITETIRDLHDFNIDVDIKTRLYSIPVYTSILEGCISNFLRVIVAITGQCIGKDYTNQHALGALVQIISSKGYNELADNINVNIRNAINHGKVQLKRQAISSKICFYYVEKNISKTLELNIYEFESIIDKTYDTASALLLVLIKFFNEHKSALKVDLTKNEYIPFSVFSMELSLPEVVCHSISDTGNNKQLNIEIEVSNADKTFIAEIVSLLSVIVYGRYNQYEQYMFSFSSLRMQGGWIRYKKQEIIDMYNKTENFATVLQKIIDRNDFVYFEPYTENIDLNEIKYFCFPNYNSEKSKINRISDASVPGRKRLRACLYIEDETDKNAIINLITSGIEWLKNVRNVPSATLPHKYGDMEADSLYINVYRKNERRSRELYKSNENFVCFVDYNIDGETTLQNGGLPLVVWNSLYHEKINNMQIAWRESKYANRRVKKIGVNAPCPCGSGKKFKKCCRGNGIYDY